MSTYFTQEPIKQLKTSVDVLVVRTHDLEKGIRNRGRALNVLARIKKFSREIFHPHVPAVESSPNAFNFEITRNMTKLHL